MKTTRLVVIALGFLIASVCAGCAVRYVPRIPGFQPGYTDLQLGEATYQIKIGEAWSKDWPDLEKFAMYRAAEIAESRSRRYFSVLNASSYTNIYYLSSPAISSTSARASRIGSTTFINATTTTTPATTSTVSGGWYILEFRLLTDAEALSQERVVDSLQVKRDLKMFIDGRR